MDKMKIYYKSPIWLQNLYTTVYGYLLKKERYGKQYRHFLKKFGERDFTDEVLLKNIQNQRLREIISFTYTNSEYYKALYKDINIEDIKTVEDITKLPIVDKEDFRKNLDQVYSIPVKDAIMKNTSGTTGKAMLIRYTSSDLSERLAYLDNFKRSHGFINLKMRKATFNSSEIVFPGQKAKIFWRDNFSIKQRIYSGFNCQGDNVPYYIANLNKFKPHAIDGYASAIYQLARYIIEKKLTLSFTPVAIFTTAETLLPHYKKSIEEAFNCKIYDQYASSEGAPYIVTCEKDSLHYCIDTGVIETNPDGTMIVTSFTSKGTPLIRYNIGDKIIFDSTDKKCSCGLAYPLVKSIEGRTYDYVLTKTQGKLVSTYLSLPAGDFQSSIKAMQYRQDNLDEIDVLVEVDENFTDEIKDLLIKKLNIVICNQMKYNIKIVDKIPKDKSGKFRFVINNIEK